MSVFKLNFIAPSTEDFKKIGVDKAYVDFAIKQHEFRTVKISDLSCAQANILKQTAIACGTDCAVHRETITGKIEKTDCILSGTMREFEKICEKLSGQPLKLKILAEEIKRFVLEPPGVFLINKKRFERSKCYIMGILNITPDSFSDGGKYFDKEKALKHADELIKDGADILDIGGESTRPYAEPVTADEEIERVLPVIIAIRAKYPHFPLSIDTRNAKTAKEAIKAGADIVNDVSAGLWDGDMFKTCAELGVPIILNHSQGTPENMQDNPLYENCTEEVFESLITQAKKAENAGIGLIIIDPGLGFGKTKEQNWEIIKNIKRFVTPKYPLLVGHSRKTFLKETFNTEDIDELDNATAVVSGRLAQNGVNIIRVHNVKAHKALKYLQNNFSD